MAHHKRHRPRIQRAACFCKYGKKIGVRALRGPAGELSRGHLLRLRERAKDMD